ncbi:MAG: nicotinate-nucleotide adenylyltransferase [Clostridiaceae bacterium]|nr:nicotinate-nucleotide adenylyltransferase [Clostridiaceae bacterium]
MVSDNHCTSSCNKKYSVKIGIMGGTFDPIHHGHLATAEAVREALALDQVLFVPVGDPPHKEAGRIVDKRHRYAMTSLAISTNPFFKVSSVEIDREGYTYTVDTIKYFKTQYEDDTGFYFIVGADTVGQLHTWKDAQFLLGMCEFAVATRPGYDKKELLRQIECLNKKYNGKINLVEVPLLDISSTLIRKKIKAGLSIKYLVPESVEKYIIDNALYRM